MICFFFVVVQSLYSYFTYFYVLHFSVDLVRMEIQLFGTSWPYWFIFVYPLCICCYLFKTRVVVFESYNLSVNTIYSVYRVIIERYYSSLHDSFEKNQTSEVISHNLQKFSSCNSEVSFESLCVSEGGTRNASAD